MTRADLLAAANTARMFDLAFPEVPALVHGRGFKTGCCDCGHPVGREGGIRCDRHAAEFEKYLTDKLKWD